MRSRPKKSIKKTSVDNIKTSNIRGTTEVSETTQEMGSETGSSLLAHSCLKSSERKHDLEDKQNPFFVRLRTPYGRHERKKQALSMLVIDVELHS